MNGGIILTTTNSVDGRTIEEYLGIIFGENLESMVSRAQEYGADAVVGIRFNEHPGGELTIGHSYYYGTAVKFQ